jgi:hypothetical protein
MLSDWMAISAIWRGMLFPTAASPMTSLMSFSNVGRYLVFHTWTAASVARMRSIFSAGLCGPDLVVPANGVGCRGVLDAECPVDESGEVMFCPVDQYVFIRVSVVML